jgi:hypothetical protein
MLDNPYLQSANSSGLTNKLYWSVVIVYLIIIQWILSADVWIFVQEYYANFYIFDRLATNMVLRESSDEQFRNVADRNTSLNLVTHKVQFYASMGKEHPFLIILSNNFYIFIYSICGELCCKSSSWRSYAVHDCHRFFLVNSTDWHWVFKEASHCYPHALSAICSMEHRERMINESRTLLQSTYNTN